MKTYLKVKLKYLAEESRIIKDEKERWLRKAAIGRQKALETDRKNPARAWMFQALHEHRVKVLRPEARDSNLAYGFLRGHPYSRIESLRYTDPNWENVYEIITRFHSYRYKTNVELNERFEEWKNAAPPKQTRSRNFRGGPRVHRTLKEWHEMLITNANHNARERIIND